MVDGHSRVVSLICVVRAEGKYLLVQRSFRDKIFPGLWQNLGGTVDSRETIEEALRREIWEETGIEVGKRAEYKYLTSYSWSQDKSESDRLGLIFLIDLPVKPSRIALPPELTQYGWFSLEDTVMVPTIGVSSPTGTLAQLMYAYVS